MRSTRTYRQVSRDTGVPLELLGSFLEAIGFARMAPDELIREDELAVVPLLQLGHASGFLDQLWSTRLGRGYQEGLGLIARVEREVWQARSWHPCKRPAPTRRPPWRGPPSGAPTSTPPP